MTEINNKIHVLSDTLANKIAAGEVVERPASVVKELVENAIDAGAGKIELFIKNGGKLLIHIVDNGCGLSEADLPLAFQRHATSKIKTENDLENIHSLGFRGEALPSIASVAHVDIKTKEKDAATGLVFSVIGGKAGPIRRTASNTGTSIEIKNLFFNTPARRKFLKSDNAENQQILIVLKRFFLAYPSIEFDLSIDDKKLFSLKACDLKSRISEVFGDEMSADLLKVENSIGGITISGFIGKPSIARKTRSHQHLFLNGRPIQDRNLGYAINQGYSETLEEGTHPVYCLFIEMDTSLVDVNIHPTKMFVRFSNDRTMFYLFLNSIKRALNDQGVLADFSQIKSGSAIQKVIIEEQNKTSPESQKNEILKSNKKEQYILNRKGQQVSLAYFKSDFENSGNELQKNTYDSTLFDGLNHKQLEVRLWQVHRKYIFSEIKSGLVVIDQHLAHARILYEQTLKIFEKKASVNAQKLLFPQKITLALDDFLVFKDIYQLMQRIGFTINVFSGNTIIIEEMPADVKIGRESQILMDIIDYYKNNPHGSFSLNEKIAAAYAYKNAVKSGEELNNTKMNSLVDQLFACEYPFYAPDGKPVIVSIDLEELARKFR